MRTTTKRRVFDLLWRRLLLGLMYTGASLGPLCEVFVAFQAASGEPTGEEEAPSRGRFTERTG